MVKLTFEKQISCVVWFFEDSAFGDMYRWKYLTLVEVLG
jgi:hypothetical protein